MKDKAMAMVLGSFLGDSLALGVHWIYDVERINREVGRVDKPLKPKPDSFHPSKGRGDFTHYGDQTYVLLESIASRNGFDPSDFSMRWRRLFDGYSGYYDKATRAAMENLLHGKSPEAAGSSSTDLAGASRIAPVVYRYREDLDRLMDAARIQTRMTHNDPLVIDSAEFFSRVAFSVLRGQPPAMAIQQVTSNRFSESPISQWVREGIQSRDTESVAAIGRFGQSCQVDQAFPGVVHLVSKYENDFKEALIQAVMAGGDSAARGMLVGMVLGAYLGEESLPPDWVSSLTRKKDIGDLLDQIS